MLRVAAIAIAVIAAFIGVVYLRYSGDGDGGIDDARRGVPVVVATQDIAAGTEIKEGMLKVIYVPEDQVVTGAFSDTTGLVGNVTRVAIAANEQIITFKGVPVDIGRRGN